METTTFSEFRRNARKYFDLVQRGRKVRILRHGKPVADLVPACRSERPLAWKRPGLRMVLKDVSLSDVVLREREESSK